MSAVGVTQVRVVHSEWIKFRTLRSTFFTMVAAVGALVGIGWLFSYVFMSQWSHMPPRRRADFSAITTPLNGFFLAQLAIGVLGVLVISGEYSTGMIRATLSAVPGRLPVLWAKSLVFTAVTFVTMLVSAFLAFFGGQLLFTSKHLDTSLSAPHALRVVFGVALYLTVVGLLGVAFGALFRNTAGAIAAVFGMLLVLPILGELLPSTWSPHVTPYLPSNAGQDLVTLRPDPGSLAPWTGFGVFCIYAVVALAAAAILLKRRDA
jgi:ABC-2 type transport system permease protein